IRLIADSTKRLPTMSTMESGLRSRLWVRDTTREKECRGAHPPRLIWSRGRPAGLPRDRTKDKCITPSISHEVEDNLAQVGVCVKPRVRIRALRARSCSHRLHRDALPCSPAPGFPSA